MEPVGAWGPAQTAAWLRGLDTTVQGYLFEEWGLAGTELLRLSEGALEALGVWRVGHQELLLEAVEQLRALDTELGSTSLRTLTERLWELAQRTETTVLEGSPGGATLPPPPITLLACVVDLIGAAKRLFSWLNRYLFSTLNDFSSTRDIVLLCAHLVEVLQMDCSTAERNSQILYIVSAGQRRGCGHGGPSSPGPTPYLHFYPQCQHIIGICKSIVGCSPPALLDRRAMLQHVELALPLTPRESPPDSPSTPTLPPELWGSPPPSPSTPVLPPEPPGSPPASPSTPMLPFSPLGLEITSTSSCMHFVSMTSSEALAVHGGRILPGDEIVQVNEQVVVGWTRINLVKKLLEKASGVSLVLKKVPLSLPGCPLPTRLQVPGAHLDGVDLPKSSKCPSSPSSPASSTTADVDSGPDPTADKDKHSTSQNREDVGELQPAALSLGTGEDAVQEASTPPGTPSSLCAFQPCTAECSPTAAPRAQSAEPSQTPREGSPETGRRPKGVATRLSRRRVSCRDLGRVDCDGWLLKKKDHVGFMAQKWKRCWFVLKGHTLYWYNHPNDDKAAGLINVATYNLESTREQKKKYVFQLSHDKYKPFVFAAETLADLSMWVSHLITAKTKHALAHQPVPHREEDCYSETEAEDPDDESPRHGCELPNKRLQNAPEKGQLFQTGGESSSPQSSPQPHSPAEPGEEDLESLMWCLRQGGVSLIGRQRFLTQEQCRKSFIRRNKNPCINEKVHAVRALQSTLKAKLAELQAIEQLLDDAALTSEKFQRWKEEHQDLYQELQEWWAQQQGQDSSGGHEAEQRSPAEAAEP
ncbi:connector enhancer of kinase suppressor of ras 1 isoform X1 [Coturnix japonica]|uniref:connector enhancer of kinase suppressor of ras 1 isoform X1 n=1 Tax=Coturnix japonica TaxID=93934 RepID=UPI0013A5E5D7|nr:connector enhancer of kinase suppressor of ras 1 isoform X1 [Coturnix japonica]